MRRDLSDCWGVAAEGVASQQNAKQQCGALLLIARAFAIQTLDYVRFFSILHLDIIERPFLSTLRALPPNMSYNVKLTLKFLGCVRR